MLCVLRKPVKLHDNTDFITLLIQSYIRYWNSVSTCILSFTGSAPYTLIKETKFYANFYWPWHGHMGFVVCKLCFLVCVCVCVCACMFLSFLFTSYLTKLKLSLHNCYELMYVNDQNFKGDLWNWHLGVSFDLYTYNILYQALPWVEFQLKVVPTLPLFSSFLKKKKFGAVVMSFIAKCYFGNLRSV